MADAAKTRQYARRVTRIPDSAWIPIRDYRGEELTDDEWRAAVERLPLWSVVKGVVLAHLPMGYFVGLGDRVIGQVEVVAITDDVRRIDPSTDYPAIGAEVPSVSTSDEAPRPQ